MKFFVLFLLLGTVPCWAGIAYSQNVKMSLDMENTTVHEMCIRDSPNIVTIFVGIFLGIFFGSLPIAFPGIPTPVKLGLAGGPLIRCV